MDGYEVFDLEAAIKVLAGEFPAIEDVYLFGSRRFKTGSPRSDIDILITINERIRPSELRDFTLKTCTALDIFVLENGRATSVANESYIEASTNEEVIENIHAVLLFNRIAGMSVEVEQSKKLAIDRRINHELTALPNGSIETYEIAALKKYFLTARENGLPAKPYLGVSTDEASEFIISVLRRIIDASHTVSGYGQAKDGWTKQLNDEYDFQNLFWIVTKPWLPSLSREDVEIEYDSQKKKSDFNLFNNQLVIELKHVKDDGAKRAIVKTLRGLEYFYTQHPNIRVLIFGILVDEEVKLDDIKWEADFSFVERRPMVKTIIIRNKKGLAIT